MFVPPFRRILPAALALLLAATAFAAEGSVPAGYQTQSSRRLAAGVDHEALALADPAQSVHVARLAPGAARLVAVSSHDAVAHQDFGAETPSAMCRRVGCFAGINGDFAGGSGEPVGGVVSGGRLLRSPVPGRPQLVVTRDGRLHAAPLDWSGAVSGHGRTLPIGGVNVALHPGDVVLYTSAWAGDTPQGADIELLVRSSGAAGTIGTTRLEITGVRSERGSIPSGGAVLAASGPAAEVLQEFADRAGPGSPELELSIRTALDVVESVGGHPAVLRGGQPAFPDVDDSFTRARHPRALVGWNPAGEVVLVTVDGGRAGASGMTLAEAAELLAGLGATDGFGFDHSSATFVTGGEVQNLPVDDLEPGAPAPTEGREVAPGHWERPAVNALMVVARPASSPPAPPTTNPGPGGGSGVKPGAATGTTAAPKLSVAGGGSTPGPGTGTPAATAGTPLPPNSGGGILGNLSPKRPRRAGKGGKGGKGGNGGHSTDGSEEELATDPSIPGWDDITAALTPEAVAAGEEGEDLSLDVGLGDEGPGRAVGPMLLQLLAVGMIVTVVAGLHRAHRESRPRPALWL